MKWTVEWHPYAEDDVAALHPQIRRRVLQALARAAEGQRSDLRKLRGRDNEWRLRVGDWRVILTFDHSTSTITVWRALHRREAYRRN